MTMKRLGLLAASAALLGSTTFCAAQSTTSSASACPTILTPSYEAPVVGSGWTAQLIAKGLTKPRSLIFDQNGALLVVQQGSGIVRMTFTDNGGTCLIVNDTKTVVENSDLNHAVQLSADGRTLYASTSNDVFRWPYDAAAGTLGDRETLVTNMSNGGVSQSCVILYANNTLLVSRGSSENLDFGAAQLDSGISQIRAFDIGNLPNGRPYNYASEGRLMGWGLRNSVGVAEHPGTGGIYSVENSADQIDRSGTDIHQDNPGEEMNYHGFLNGSTEDQGGNYGYPDCFALWGTDNFPDQGNMTVGSQFTLSPNSTLNDTTCAEDRVSPRLTFQAHTAPLDMLFNTNGTTAYITFHGSWDRTDPTGYRLSSVQFDNNTGAPVAQADSKSATADVLSNADLSKCPDSCFRPVGLAWDSQGRLFMSSDSTGEIYVLQQNEMSATDGGTPTSTGTSSGTGTLVTSTSTTSPNLAPRSSRSRPGGEAIFLTGLAVALSVVCGVFFTVA
ncbi:hypothetical protein N8I77_012417 [Diaporthe amygdali]|uniref:Pyrroloquinoline quinone-dependent pyranose dehydrogenase beta-propeller domain-containing protein n=1 Tax=Phomopsis amygdali TaxID=1214568 RepID=A0AAD9S3I1_PHOAM|nr:hypothetical protein N8I77_012417 [Diaporthe amygdali]